MNKQQLFTQRMSGLDRTPPDRKRASSIMLIKNDSGEKSASIKNIPLDQPLAGYQSYMIKHGKDVYLEKNLFDARDFGALAKILQIYQQAFLWSDSSLKRHQENKQKILMLREANFKLEGELQYRKEKSSRLRSNVISERQVVETYRERWSPEISKEKDQGYPQQKPQVKKDNYFAKKAFSSEAIAHENKLPKKLNSESDKVKKEDSHFEPDLISRGGLKLKVQQINENSMQRISDKIQTSQAGYPYKCDPVQENIHSHTMGITEFSKGYHRLQQTQSKYLYDPNFQQNQRSKEKCPELDWQNHPNISLLKEKMLTTNIFGNQDEDSEEENQKMSYYVTFMKDYIKAVDSYQAKKIATSKKREQLG